MLRGMCLVDCAGFADANKMRREMADREVDLADTILICAASARAASDQ